MRNGVPLINHPTAGFLSGDNLLHSPIPRSHQRIHPRQNSSFSFNPKAPSFTLNPQAWG